MTNHPYTFFSRYGETPGTNPEELLGAARPHCIAKHHRRVIGTRALWIAVLVKTRHDHKFQRE
jgi:organic hydroperoxide reductase OsmC/OhrA